MLEQVVGGFESAIPGLQRLSVAIIALLVIATVIGVVGWFVSVITQRKD